MYGNSGSGSKRRPLLPGHALKAGVMRQGGKGIFDKKSH